MTRGVFSTCCFEGRYPPPAPDPAEDAEDRPGERNPAEAEEGVVFET